MNRNSGSTLLSLLVLAVLGGSVWFLYGYFTHGKPVENLAAYTKRVEAAAKANRLAESLKHDLAIDSDPAGFAVVVKDFMAGSSWHALPHSWAKRLPLPIAVVDLDRGQYDEIQGQLPSSARADSIAMARTIVFVRCKKNKAGQYGDIFPVNAYDLECSELAADMKAPNGPVILAAGWAINTPPQNINTTFTFGDVVAERNWEITNFVLSALPPS